MPPPPPAPAMPGSQQALQFLSSALSQRGPLSLPYAEETKFLIRQHLLSLLDSFPSLSPKISPFTHNDGRTLNLLQAHGTIPILYDNLLYNLPASIWLLERYPLSPPQVFLNPTRDMVIKLNHPFVDRSGFVHAPYLKNWIYPSSNLLDLVRILSQAFGNDPPLYSRQKPNPSSENPSEVFRRNAIKKIVDSVQGDWLAIRRVQEGETEGLLAAQAMLRRRQEEVAKGVRDLVAEKEGLEQMLQVVIVNAGLMEGWIGENGGRGSGGGEDAFEVVDAFSRQMMECTAEDLAAEDCIYALDKALQGGAIAFDVYLKRVRGLAREQFFCRAVGMKVRAAAYAS